MKVYITRHGETQWNKDGKMQGWQDSDLTEKGIECAKKLGERLKNVKFDCIYSSPLGRAVDTAKYIRGNSTTPIVIKQSLKEMGFGLWEGMKHEQVEELYSNEHFNFWNKPHLYEPIDGESFQCLMDRARRVLQEIVDNNSYENVMIVSHAIFIKAILAIVKNYSLEKFWNPPFMHGTALSIIQCESNKTHIVLEADISHLK